MLRTSERDDPPAWACLVAAVVLAVIVAGMFGGCRYLAEVIQ